MDMEYRRLGKSGLKVSSLSFGAWVTFGQQVGEDVAEELLTTAYDAGVNFFDNAEAYAEGRAETVMGKLIRKLGWPRDTYVVSSKVYFGAGGERANQTGLSRKHVFEACHAALKRLQVDYLDLYFCHRPDPETPIEETARTMHDLIAQGKILYWGTSEWSMAQIQSAHAICRDLGLTPPTMEQPQYNLLHRHRFEVEYATLYRDVGLGTTIWSPLASGILTGKYNKGIPKDSRLAHPDYTWLRERVESPEAKKRLAAVKEIEAIARDLEVTLPRLAIAWCLKNPRVSTVILGASQPGQLKENLGALEVAPGLTTDIMAKLDALTRPVAFTH